MNTLVPQQVWIPAPPPVRLPPPDVWIPAPPPVRLPPPDVWIPVIPERPRIQAWTPLGWVPLATGPTFPPGTRIKIEVPITNNSNESFSTRIRVGIFEGSILPGRGDRIATIDSSWQMLNVGQTRDFSVTHTTRRREGVERRDVNIEVQYLDAGRVESGGSREWDDLFWVKEKIEFVIGEPTVTAA